MPERTHRLAAWAVPWVACMLQACIVVPQTQTNYNERCQFTEHHMTLTSVQVGALQSCANDGCAYLLVAAGAVSAASAVISSSIVVVGNVAYWLEEWGRCPPGVAPKLVPAKGNETSP